MPAPIYKLPTTGSDPKTTTLESHKSAIQTVVDELYSYTETVEAFVDTAVQTSDALNLPVSTATQAALDLKADRVDVNDLEAGLTQTNLDLRTFELSSEKWYLPPFASQNFVAVHDGEKVNVSYESSESSGTLYYVILSDSAAEPSRGEIKAGTGAYGSAVEGSGSVPVTSGTLNFEIEAVLAEGETYQVWAFQESVDEFFGIRHDDVITTKVLLAAGARDGTPEDIESNAAVIINYQSDPSGGTDAIHFVDTNVGSVGSTLVFALLEYLDGEQTITFTFSKISGDWTELLIQPINISNGPVMRINATTGAIAVNNFTNSPTITDLGGGFFKVSIVFDTSGLADRDGAFKFQLRFGGSSVGDRNGTQRAALHDFTIR